MGTALLVTAGTTACPRRGTRTEARTTRKQVSLLKFQSLGFTLKLKEAVSGILAPQFLTRFNLATSHITNSKLHIKAVSQLKC
jgi:hypothetical protein